MKKTYGEFMRSNPSIPKGDRTVKAIKKCANFLSECLKIGWKKSQLDDLEKLWWKYHDNNGNLITKSVAK